MDLPATQICYDYEEEPTQKIVQNSLKDNEQVGILIVNNNSYPIYKGISKIGRNPECNIVLNDQSVSKFHAEIEANKYTSSTWICDLESSNKTILNNVTLRPSRFYELQDNSVLEFGRIKAIYKNHNAKNDFVIPETPMQSKQKHPTAIIPGTPDSLLSNSSVFEEGISTIAGTQSCFRKSGSSQSTTEQQLQKISQNNEKNSACTLALDSNNEHKQTETNNRNNKIEEKKVSEDGNESNIQLSDQNKNQALTSFSGTSRFSVETMQNSSTHEQNDPSTSCESEDIFEAVTQRVNIDTDFTNRRDSCSSSDETNIDEDAIINDLSPTQKIHNILESSTPIRKTNLEDQDEKLKNICDQETINSSDDNDMLYIHRVSLPDSTSTTKEIKIIKKQIVIDNIDTLNTQIVNLPYSNHGVNNEKQKEQKDDIVDIDLLNTQPVSIPERINQNMSPSLIKEEQYLIDYDSIEDVNYETAATQLIEDVNAVPKKQDSKTKHSGDKKAHEVNVDDSLEKKLNDMFEEVNDDHVNETSMISTQCLQNVLECSQSSSRVVNTPSHLVDNTLSAQVQNVKSVDSNSQKSEADSQTTEKYFSSFISKRKHNVLTDTQESIDLNDTISTRKKRKESNVKTLETEEDDTESTKKPSKRNIKGKQKKTTHSEKTVDYVEKDLLNSFEVSVHSSQEETKCAETSKSLDEEDDDILIRLPEVNISGTFQNPSTASSTSPAQTRSTRRSSNKKTNKKADISEVHKNTFSATSMSDSMEDMDYENLKKMAEALLPSKNNEIKSTKKRANTRKKRDSASDVSKQNNSTNSSNKPAPNTRGRKSKGNTTVESKSILSYVTRKSQRKNTESMNEKNSNTIPINSNKRQIREQQMNIKTSKTNSSNVKDNTSVNIRNSPIGEESQEVEMIMNKSLATVSENTRKRKKMSATSDNDSLENSNTSNINRINSMEYKIPIVRVKRTRLDKNTSSQSSIESTTTENSLVDNSDSSVATNTTKSRPSRSKRINAKEKKNENNTNILTKMSTRRNTLNSTSVNVENNKETVSVRPASTIPKTVSRLSTSLNNSFSVKEKILFTGITDNELLKVLKTLGGTKVEDPSKCTVLVTDKIRRTTKFLSALARAVPIVSINWLQESKRAGQFLEWENYMLKDPAMEAKYGFRLRKSLDKAREKKLLEGYTVLLTPNIQSPPTSELKVMIQSCGGKAFIRTPPKLSEKTIIISNQDNLENARKLLLKVPKNVTIQSTEFLLTGILKQELDFVRHKLI